MTKLATAAGSPAIFPLAVVPGSGGPMEMAMFTRRIPWQERFWRHVRPCGDNECWMWQGTLQGHGYGELFLCRPATGPRQVRGRAHRLSWILHNGPIPKGMLVCHHCDMRACVNPNHLFLGTLADNNRDMVRKGRQVRGARTGGAKLAPASVRDIRRRHANGAASARGLAQEYGVTSQSVYQVLHRHTWAHVDDAHRNEEATQ